MNGPDQEDDGGTSVQSGVNAGDGAPLHTHAASSVFNWRGAGAAAAPAPAPTAAPQPPRPEEEETMATRKKATGAARARKTKGGSPQFQICTALLAHGAVGRDELHEKLDGVTRTQLYSALHTARANKRLEWDDKSKTFSLTKLGEDWVNASANPEKQETAKAAAKRGTAHRRGGKRKPSKPREEVDTPPAGDDDDTATFRCGVMSDGAFFLSKGEDAIELDAEEHREMLRYLERMAVDEAGA